MKRITRSLTSPPPIKTCLGREWVLREGAAEEDHTFVDPHTGNYVEPASAVSQIYWGERKLLGDLQLPRSADRRAPLTDLKEGPLFAWDPSPEPGLKGFNGQSPGFFPCFPSPVYPGQDCQDNFLLPSSLCYLHWEIQSGQVSVQH